MGGNILTPHPGPLPHGEKGTKTLPMGWDVPLLTCPSFSAIIPTKEAHLMDWKLFSVTFVTVFLAEMGDKTQLATMALTGESKKMVTVFLGAASALVIATLIGVLVGGVLSRYVPENIIRKVAALFFILTGILFFFGKL